MQMPTDLRIPTQVSAAGPDAGDEIDLLTIVGTLWRGKLVLLGCMITALALAVWYLVGLAVPTFQASAQMSLVVRSETVVDLESVLSGITPDQSSINTEMDVIRSRVLMGRLVDELDLTEDPEFNTWLVPPGLMDRLLARLPHAAPAAATEEPSEDAIRNSVIDALRGAISVVPEDDSYVFTISATTGDPAKSALIANTLAALYRDDQIAIKVAATESAAIWLAKRVAELQAELQASQVVMNDLRTRNTLISDEAITALNAQSVEVTAQLQAAELAVTRAQESVAAFEAAEGTDFVTRAAASGDPQLQGLADSAAEGNPPAVQRFDRRFEQLLLQQRSELARAMVAVTELHQEADKISAQYDKQSDALIEIKQMEGDAEATAVLYETFLVRLKETTLQVGVHQADSRILSEATRGYKVAPRSTLLLALSVVLGLIVGALIVFVREALQNTYRTADAVERRTGRPVLGQIPQIPEKTRQGIIAYLTKKPTSAAAEAIRNLRTSVLMSNIDKPPQVILSTSSIPGEGKTTLALALAQSLAGLNRRVILIEGDIRRRKFQEYFPAAAQNPGILAVLAGQVPLTEAVWRHPDVGIDVLMGEKSVVNAADVFSSDSFQRLMTELRATYDHIIIDTPPVLVVPDARVIGPLADAVIYAVRWDATTHSQVAEGLKQLRSVGVPVAGLVLSQIDPVGMRRYGYSGQYGAYSRYAKGYYES